MPIGVPGSSRGLATIKGMSTYTAAKSVRQWRHPASRSESHIQDKGEGEARRQITFVPVKTPATPSPKRNFAALGLEGHEFIRQGNEWHPCKGREKFADYLVAEARTRSWYISETTRNGRQVQMKRRVEAPIKVLTTTFSPWLSEWTYQNLSLGEVVIERLRLIRNRWLAAAMKLVDGLAYVLGFSFHADTSNPHFDLCLSRQDGEGGRIGRAGLGLMGPWAVGVERQVRAGAEISPEKWAQAERSADNFARRYPGHAPLDIEFAKRLDIASAEVLGGELEVYRIEYARMVPILEQQHAAAKQATLDQARLVLTRVPPVPGRRNRVEVVPEP